MSDVGEEVVNICQGDIVQAVLMSEGATCGTVVVKETTYTPTVPRSLRFHEELSPQHEGVVFQTQPKLRAYDDMVSLLLSALGKIFSY